MFEINPVAGETPAALGPVLWANWYYKGMKTLLYAAQWARVAKGRVGASARVEKSRQARKARGELT